MYDLSLVLADWTCNTRDKNGITQGYDCHLQIPFTTKALICLSFYFSGSSRAFSYLLSFFSCLSYCQTKRIGPCIFLSFSSFWFMACLAWLLFCTIYITILCLYFTSVPVYCSSGLVLRYSSRDRPENPEYHMTNSVSGPSRPPQKINFRQGNRREWALSRPLLHISWSNAARHYYTHLIADRVAGLYPQSTPVTLQPRRNHGRQTPNRVLETTKPAFLYTPWVFQGWLRPWAAWEEAPVQGICRAWMSRSRWWWRV